jgi:eukaryotic-like serine/threonine-protein kinase
MSTAREDSRLLRQVYAGALQRDPEERPEYLDRACAGKSALRARVNSLLAAHADDFPEEELAAADTRADVRDHGVEGRVVGHYIIRREIGRGGMGVVYLADDTRLSRRVALKALSPGLGSELAARERLRLEAHAAAGLSHPGIATVYALEEIGDVLYLACEFVPGEPLRALLKSGPLPLDHVVDIGTQLAKALAAAHTQGVVHRDIKPENVMKTPSGVIKVLDFGLARAESSVHSKLTQTGVIVGTPAYLAPEQVLGKKIDFRTDVFALGVVVYEMASGVNPFVAPSLTATLARIVEGDVEPLSHKLPEATPQLDHIVATCLRKDPLERYASTQEAVADFERLQIELSRSRPTEPRVQMREQGRTRARWTPWLLPAAVTAIMAMAGTLAWLAMDQRSRGIASAAPVVRFDIEPLTGVGSISNVALASDGRFVVYEGRVDGESRLFLRRLDQAESRLLPGTEGARWPFTSPDGAWVGFFRDSKIYKVSTSGGDPLAICDVRGGPGATWTDDGRIVFSRTWLAGLSVVSADAGTPTVLTTPDPAQQEIGHWWPSLLPDGHILFTVVRAGTGLNDARVALLDPANGRYRVLFPGARASWIRSGHLLFYRAGGYHAVPFNLSTLQVTGESFPILADAQELDPSGDWPQPVVTAPGGALAYLSGSYVPASRLTWIDKNGAFTPLASAERPFISVRLSPDGRRVATASLEAGRLLIRLFDLQRGTEQVPQIAGMNWNPVWLPDGRLSFTSMRKGDFDVYVKDVNGSGSETAILSGPDDTDPVAWTRDGQLVFQGSEPDGAYPLKLLDPREPTRSRRLTEQHVENGGSLSPDDRWLAYHAAATGRPLIYVRLLAGDAPAVTVSSQAGEFPTFLPDGKRLAFVRGRQLMVQSWRDNAGRFETGAESALAALSVGSGWTFGAPFDAAADGRLLALVRTHESPPPRIRIVLGWDREVSRLEAEAPAKR